MAVTTAAVTGIVATGVSTGMSFAQASKQRKLQEEAQNKAQQMMQEARQKLEVNVYEQLSIQKEPYELQREAMLTQGATALQAGVEGEGRGAAATAGRVQMAQQAGQAQLRAAMGQEMAQLEQLTAAEESRLRDIGVQLDLGEVAGAQLAARDAEAARQQALQQGAQGIVNMAGQVASFVPLYSASQQARQFDRALKMAGNDYAEVKNQLNTMYPNANVANMSDIEVRDFATQLTPDALKTLQRNLMPQPKVGATTGVGAGNIFKNAFNLGLDIFGF